jgi:hypothetical protein
MKKLVGVLMLLAILWYLSRKRYSESVTSDIWYHMDALNYD